ncbi:hypothetical protein ACAG39_10365 [Caldicellulosiruptoraceae bacterium PP1]
MYNSVNAEIKKIVSNKTIVLIYLIYLFVLSYLYRESLNPIFKHNFPGYFPSLFLYSLTLFGIIIFIIIGTFTISIDYNSNMIGTCFFCYKKNQLLIAKLVAILIINTLIVIITYLFGIFLSLLSKDNFIFLPLSKQILQIITIIVICTFWSFTALLLTIITKNTALSIVFLFLLSFFEPVLYNKIEVIMIKKYFLVFNQMGILKHFFSNLGYGGIIIIPDYNYNSLLFSLFMFFLYFAIEIVIMLLYIKQNERLYILGHNYN